MTRDAVISALYKCRAALEAEGATSISIYGSSDCPFPVGLHGRLICGIMAP